MRLLHGLISNKFNLCCHKHSSYLTPNYFPLPENIMQPTLYSLSIKSVIKIWLISLLGYIPLFAITLFLLLIKEPQPSAPLGQFRDISLQEALYGNILFWTPIAIINLITLIISIWCWSRMKGIRITCDRVIIPTSQNIQQRNN